MVKPIEMIKRGGVYVAVNDDRQPVSKPKAKRHINVANDSEANMLSNVLVGLVEDFFKIVRKEMFK